MTRHGKVMIMEAGSRMGRDRKAEHRARMRRAGLRPLELWLPNDLIDRIDKMKSEELTSRDAVIIAVIQDTLHLQRPTKAEEQMMLL